MKKILFSIFLTLLGPMLNAQIVQQWVATHNGQGDYNDRYTCLLRDPMGNYYLGGSTVNPGADRDFLVVKADASGNILWSLQLDGEGHAADEVSGIALSPVGTLVVTGISKGENTSDDFWTIQMNPDGDTLWSRRYDNVGEYDQPNGIAIDKVGNIIVTGLSDSDASASENDDYVTIKYDVNGQLLWSRTFNGFGDAIDRSVGVVVNELSQIYVTGRSDNGMNDDYVTICYDANGSQQWIKYDDRGGRDRATALALDFEGNLLVTGQSNNGDNDDFWVLKYSPNGTAIWQKAYDFVDDDRAVAMATDAAGNVYVTGQSDQNFDATRNWDIATVSFSPNGNPRWAARYDGALSQDEFPAAIAVDSLGHVFVTGRGDSDPGIAIDNEIVTLKYQPSNGAEQWRAIYAGLSNRDYSSNALGIDGSGGCLLAGYAEDSTAFRNALLLKYSDTGILGWEKQFNGAGDNSDSARKLAADDFGNLYAAGYTVSNGDNRNLTLVHFDTDGGFNCRYVENGSAVSAFDDAQGLVLSDDGLPIVMGYAKNSGSSNDIFISKLQQACDTIWDKNINGGANGSERAYDMVKDGGGSIILTGRSDQLAGPLANDVCYTLKLRESDGATLWVRKYESDTAFAKPERGVVVRVKDPNQIYVTGRAFNGVDYDIFLLKYDANGNELWHKSWALIDANDEPVDMALDAFGNIYVLANTAPVGADTLHDIMLIKFDASGSLLWSVRYNHSANGNDEAVALAVDINGDIILTGKVDTKPGTALVYGIVVIKHNPDGSLAWVKEFSSSDDTYYIPDALAINNNAQIYLAGHSNQGTVAVPNINVVAYILNPNGQQLWLDTYDGSLPNGSDVPNTILLKDNDFYIGGSTEQEGHQKDLMVIKYSGAVVPTISPSVPSLSAYPNPVGNTLYFKGLPLDQNIQVELTDSQGRLLLQKQFNSNSSVECLVNDLPEGILFFRIFTDKHLLSAGKVFHTIQ